MKRSKLTYRVFSSGNKLLGRLHYVEDAAALVGSHGKGATIRSTIGDKPCVLFTQGVDGDALDSYDAVAITVNLREEAKGL